MVQPAHPSRGVGQARGHCQPETALQNLVSQIIPLIMCAISFCLWLVQNKRNPIQNPGCVSLAIKSTTYRSEEEESISYSHNVSSEQRSESTLGSALGLHGKVWVAGGLLLQSCQFRTIRDLLLQQNELREPRQGQGRASKKGADALQGYSLQRGRCKDIPLELTRISFINKWIWYNEACNSKWA